jgi:hypothetical protein
MGSTIARFRSKAVSQMMSAAAAAFRESGRPHGAGISQGTVSRLSFERAGNAGGSWREGDRRLAPWHEAAPRNPGKASPVLYRGKATPVADGTPDCAVPAAGKPPPAPLHPGYWWAFGARHATRGKHERFAGRFSQWGHRRLGRRPRPHRAAAIIVLAGQDPHHCRHRDLLRCLRRAVDRLCAARHRRDVEAQPCRRELIDLCRLCRPTHRRADRRLARRTDRPAAGHRRRGAVVRPVGPRLRFGVELPIAWGAAAPVQHQAAATGAAEDQQVGQRQSILACSSYMRQMRKRQ